MRYYNIYILILIIINVYCKDLSISDVTLLIPPAVPIISSISSNKGSVQYPLQAYGGCFQWKTNNPNVVTYLPVEESNCEAYVDGEVIYGYTKVYVSAVALQGRRSAWITAEDIISKKIVECEAFVDQIASISILTNTRTVNVGDVETLNVQGFDLIGNVFSTLEGLIFEWTSSRTDRLHNVLLSEALLDVSNVRQQIEDEHKLSDRLAVKGLAPGKSNVTVKLIDSRSTAIPASVEILVIEPLRISPPLAYIAPACELSFVLQTKYRYRENSLEQQLEEDNNKMLDDWQWQEINMPSNQYKWSVDNRTVLDHDPDLGIVWGKQIGFSKINAGNIDIDPKQQDAEVFVVWPALIKIQIATDSNVHNKKNKKKNYLPRSVRGSTADWYLVETKNYILDVFLYDKDGNQMIITPNIRFEINLSGKSVILKSELLKTKASVLLNARELGLTDVQASLSFILNPKTNEKVVLPTELIASGRLSVTSPIKITRPSPIILPDISMCDSERSSVVISAVGGSGHYRWFSKNLNVITLTNNDTLSTQSTIVRANTRGTTFVVVEDIYNSDNFDEATVIVSPLGKIDFLSGIREIEMNDVQPIAVKVSDIRGRPFASCTSIQSALIMNPSGGPLVIQSISTCYESCPLETHESKNCILINLKGLKSGFTLLKAQWSENLICEQSDVDNRPVATILSSFPPLQTYPSLIRMSSFSQVEVSWCGGPLPWSERLKFLNNLKAKSSSNPNNHLLVGLPDNIFENNHHNYGLNSDLLSNNQASLKIESGLKTELEEFQSLNLKEIGKHSYTLTCEMSHMQNITIRVANMRSSSLQHPVQVKKLIPFKCYTPLNISPLKLSMGVGATRQLFFKESHVLSNELLYTVEDHNVLSINKNGLIKGKALGISNVHAVVPDHSKRPNCGLSPILEKRYHLLRGVNSRPYGRFHDGLHFISEVTVQFEDFHIVTATKRLLQGHRTFASLRGVNNEVPGDSAFELVDCRWTSDSKAIYLLSPLKTLDIHNDHLDENEYRQYHGLSVQVYALRPGRTVVTAHIRVPTTGSSVAEYIHFEQRVEFIVEQPLVVLSPLFLLLPFNSAGAVMTSLDDSNIPLEYIIMKDSTNTSRYSVTVDHRGVVRSGDHIEDCVLFIQTTKKQLLSSSISMVDQTASVRISVRPINELGTSLPLDTQWCNGGCGYKQDNSGSALDMCSGANASVNIILLDKLGRRFNGVERWAGEQGASAAISYRSSRPSILKVQKSSRVTVSNSGDEGVVMQLVFSALTNGNVMKAESHSSSKSVFDTPPTISSVVRVWLANNTNISPLYLPVRILSSSDYRCSEEVAMRISVKLGANEVLKDHQPLESIVVSNSVSALDRYLRAEAWFQWESDFRTKLSSVLKISKDRVVIHSVNVYNDIIAFDILPKTWEQSNLLSNDLTYIHAKQFMLQMRRSHSNLRKTMGSKLDWNSNAVVEKISKHNLPSLPRRTRWFTSSGSTYRIHEDLNRLKRLAETHQVQQTATSTSPTTTPSTPKVEPENLLLWHKDAAQYPWLYGLSFNFLTVPLSYLNIRATRLPPIALVFIWSILFVFLLILLRVIIYIFDCRRLHGIVELEDVSQRRNSRNDQLNRSGRTNAARGPGRNSSFSQDLVSHSSRTSRSIQYI